MSYDTPVGSRAYVFTLMVEYEGLDIPEMLEEIRRLASEARECGLVVKAELTRTA